MHIFWHFFRVKMHIFHETSIAKKAANAAFSLFTHNNETFDNLIYPQKKDEQDIYHSLIDLYP